MLIDRILPIVEYALYRYLSLDPHTLKALGELSGQVIQITVSDAGFHFYLLPSNRGIRMKRHGLTPHCEICGTLLALITHALHYPNTKTALKIRILGDIRLAQTFTQILKSISIDWEAPLSAAVGDILAHQIGMQVGRLKAKMAKRKVQLGRNMTEYLQEELQCLPTPAEVETFCTDVSTLQQDVLRLEARLNLPSPTI